MGRKTDWKKLYDEGSRKWDKEANHVARTAISIISCKQCGYPVIRGYCCDNPNCPNPQEPR